MAAGVGLGLTDGTVPVAVYATLGLAAAVVMVAAPRRRGLHAAWPWYALAAGLLALTTAESLGHLHELTTGRGAPFPSWIDGISLAGYPLLAAGVVGFSTLLHADRGREALLDAAVVTCAIATLVWAPLLHSYSTANGLSTAGAVVLLTRVAGDLVVLALAARLVVAGRIRSPAAGLLAGGVAALLASDVVHHQTLTTYGAGSPVHLGSFAACILLGAAALHPSAAAFGSALPAEQRSGRTGSAALALASVLVPAVFVYEKLVTGTIGLGELLFGVAGVGFVFARLTLGLRTVRRLRETEREARVALEGARASLTESEARFRATFESAPNGVATLAVDGTVLSVNPVLAELIGYEPEEIVGGSFAQFTPPDEIHVSAAMFEEVARTGEPQRGIERRIVDRAGREHWVDGAVSVVCGAAGEPVVFIVQIADVTERKAAEEEREQSLALIHTQNAMLREADEQKSELISVVSHDLRTPLTSIMGYLELVRDGEAGPLTEAQTNFLEIIKRSADRLLTLVEDLLFISSAEAGRLQLVRSETDVAGIAAHAVEALRPKAADAGIRLTLDARWAPAHVDATRIAEVLENLLSNALKFTPPGGSVDVRAFPESTVAVLEVADTGVGMSASDHVRVFERFFRSKETGHVPGVGLGLSIVKAIVDAHGGLITVESETGEGTIFRIELPVEPPQPVPAPHADLATGAP